MPGPVMNLLADIPDEEWQSAWRAWARNAGTDVAAAWDVCPRGSWMLLMAKRLHIDRMPILLAAADCIDDGLTHSADLHGLMKPMVDDLRAAIEGGRSAGDVEVLARKATQEAAAAHRHALETQNDDARARFERWALALRALANTCEELAWITRTGEARGIWPGAPELMARAVSLSSVPRRRRTVEAAMDAHYAQLVRKRIPAFLVALHA